MTPMESEMDPDHIRAHKKAIFHKAEIIDSERCGCFYCEEIFSSSEIKEWVDKRRPENERTALCPYCGIDSVIGSKSGYPINKAFLAKMKEYWFQVSEVG